MGGRAEAQGELAAVDSQALFLVSMHDLVRRGRVSECDRGRTPFGDISCTEGQYVGNMTVQTTHVD